MEVFRRVPVRWRRIAADALLGGGLLAVTLAIDPGLLAPAADHPKLVSELGLARVHQLTLHWWIATAAMLAGVALRRRVPLVALALATAGQVVHLGMPEFADLPVDVAPAIVLCTVAARTPRRAVSIGAGAIATFAVAVALLEPGGRIFALPTFVRQWPLLLSIGAWLIGDNLRSRRAYQEQVEARARDLQREQQRYADAAAAAERERIAREMHDIVAHGLSVMVIQAQAADEAMLRRPAVARAALEVIVDTGRDALSEMRRLLDRDDPDGAGLTPQPNLGDLPDLVERVRAAGLPVTLAVDGPATSVPALIGLSAYRIVQEGLTNALKHAGPGARAEVTVRCVPGEVIIQVADDGGAATPDGGAATPDGGAATPDGADGAGRGLQGMRERVSMLGGELATGPGPGGGFRLHARLPTGTPG